MASRGVNKVILVGHLGQDPEIHYLSAGGAAATLSLATSESWRDKQSGEQNEKTEWHRVVLFGKLAEIAGEYLRKGSQVYIEGQLRTRKWFDEKTVPIASRPKSWSGSRGSCRCWVVALRMLRRASGLREVGGSHSNHQPHRQRQHIAGRAHKLHRPPPLGMMTHLRGTTISRLAAMVTA